MVSSAHGRGSWALPLVVGVPTAATWSVLTMNRADGHLIAFAPQAIGVNIRVLSANGETFEEFVLPAEPATHQEIVIGNIAFTHFVAIGRSYTSYALLIMLSWLVFWLVVRGAVVNRSRR